MFAIKKWDPFTELSTLHREMDEFFRKTFSGIAPGWFKGSWYPLVECKVKQDVLSVKADLPGIDPKDVDISIIGNQLTIKGERRTEKEEKEGEYCFSETSYGSFERTITLPEGVDTDSVHASYKNGVLEITMPVKAKALPKKVTVEIEEGRVKKVA